MEDPQPTKKINKGYQALVKYRQRQQQIKELSTPDTPKTKPINETEEEDDNDNSPESSGEFILTTKKPKKRTDESNEKNNIADLKLQLELFKSEQRIKKEMKNKYKTKYKKPPPEQKYVIFNDKDEKGKDKEKAEKIKSDIATNLLCRFK